MNSEMSPRFYDEINALSVDSDFYNEAIRKKHPNGIKRLAHLVPEIAPDQVALAQLLAEFAVEHRKDDFNSKESLQAYQDYVNARGNKTKIKLLAIAAGLLIKQNEPQSGGDRKSNGGHPPLDNTRTYAVRNAPNDPISWEACEYFLLPENRIYSHEGEKRLAPIPEPIQNLMEQCFRGEVKRPKHTPLDLRNAAIVFAVRVTLEADIKATSGNPNACQIVGDLIGKSDKTVRELWQKRSERPHRGTRLNR
jgi:hypothetical protein